MSIIIERHIQCNKCFATFGVDDRSMWKSNKQLEDSAFADGWGYDKNRSTHLCRECLEVKFKSITND